MKLLLLLLLVGLLLLSALAGAVEESSLSRQQQQQPHQQKHRALVVAERAKAFDPDSLTCLVTPNSATTFDSSSSTVAAAATVVVTNEYHDFSFYYALGVKQQQPLSYEEMFQVERVLFMAIQDDLLWCWEEQEEESLDNNNNQATAKTAGTAVEAEVAGDHHGKKRVLQQLQQQLLGWRHNRDTTATATTKERFTRKARQLGIVAFSQGSIDQQTQCKLPTCLLVAVMMIIRVLFLVNPK